MAEETTYRLPYIRLMPGQDDDLIAWLQALADEPQGVRGQRYKEIVREGLRVTGELPWQGEVRGPAVGAAVDHEALLGDIRRVLEAVIESRLGRGAVIATGTDEAGEPVTQDAGDWLESVMGGLLLGEDD